MIINIASLCIHERLITVCAAAGFHTSAVKTHTNIGEY